MRVRSCFATLRSLALSLLVAASVDGQVRPAPSAQTAASLSLRQLDVGQGDAALITTPEGKRILIDAGPEPTRVADILSASGIDTIDLVVASHAHSDHIGGMPAILSRFTVRAYIDNGIPYTSSVYRRTMSTVERTPGIQYLPATERTITLGSVTLRVLPLPLADKTQNNNSVGLLIEYGNFRALYTGDSETKELAHWLARGLIPQVAVVKAAHHGSRNGVTSQWIRTTSPRIVLISVGARNSYGHPSSATVRMWQKAGAQVYRTDLMGEITVTASRDGTFHVTK